jgi:hypothetical protein
MTGHVVILPSANPHRMLRLMTDVQLLLADTSRLATALSSSLAVGSGQLDTAVIACGARADAVTIAHDLPCGSSLWRSP